jgi:hypothetical protein
MLQQGEKDADLERTAVAAPAENEGNLICRVGLSLIVIGLTVLVIHFTIYLSVP